MKLNELNKTSVKKISNKELVSLHRRIHQLYGMAKKRKPNPKVIKFLKDIDKILVDEMLKRKMKHTSVLEHYLFKLSRGVTEKCQMG